MAESNATQVILTDDGIKIIKAQDTADNATGGVTNLNDPNLMNVIEKQTQASQYAGLTSQYNVVLSRAKEANVSTTALTTAYTNLNTFMGSVLADTTVASDVDRDTYKRLTDAYNTALSNVQTALNNSFNTDISNMQSSVSVASQAATSAAIVASQAASTGDNANQAASQAASAASKASADYKTLSTGVADGSFVHITTKTVIDDAVIGTAEIVDAAITDAKIGNIKADKITAGTIDFSKIEGTNIDASKITTGKLDADRLNVGKLSAVSSDLGDVTAGSLKGVDIVAETFSTPNGSFTTDSNGAITAKNMTLTGGTLTSPTINASTINGGTLNMQTDGLINSPYNGIQQTADQFYHPWKLNTGQLTIGQGYITSVSSGTRSINGVPKHFDSLQGTLSASYLKFTNNYGARTYIDADMFTYSNQTNDTAMVAISASGIGINMGTMSAPALTISNGYIDASSSSSYGVFGAITLGYSPHTINSDSSLFFESGHGSGNPGINIWAKGFHSLSSRLSTKRQVRLLDDEHSNSLLLGADTATFQYNQDTNADNSNEGVVIDDVNAAKQYNLPDELITRDGKAPADLMSFIARIISQNKYQARLIEDLQIRLRKVEIKNE
ncbi:phage tail protein [Lactiplantibacillus plantarum]|nr:phage tail protein [Lactiplantibacillus plantarum]